MTGQVGPDLRNGKLIYRGDADVGLIPPAWAGYLSLAYISTPPPADSINVNYSGDPADFRMLWYIGQLLPLRFGCGDSDTVWLNTPGTIIEVWAYPATVGGRQEGYDLAVRDY
jgi:hypothetical protein